MNRVTIEEHRSNLSRLAESNGLVFHLENESTAWITSLDGATVFHRFELADDWPRRVASVIEYLSR